MIVDVFCYCELALWVLNWKDNEGYSIKISKRKTIHSII